MTAQDIPSTADLADRHRAEALVYKEVRLLDEGRFEDWLELFDDECSYWIPTWNTTPEEAPSIVYDDRQRLGERVFRLVDTPAYSQMPPSRTVHLVSNFEAEVHADHLEVNCSMVVAEMRLGDRLQVGLGAPRSHAARVRYRLVERDGQLRIRDKHVYLLERDQPMYNLTFLL